MTRYIINLINTSIISKKWIIISGLNSLSSDLNNYNISRT